MWELIYAGGWLMTPIVLCSVIALVIILERAWRLRAQTIAPLGLVDDLVKKIDQGQLAGKSYATFNMRHRWAIFWQQGCSMRVRAWII